MLQVKVHRYDPAKPEHKHYDTFSVPVPSGAAWAIMDVLDYIRGNLDSSLSYYAHSICDHGICARCAVRVNGEVKLACTTPAPDQGDLLLEPVPHRKIIKDLVVR